MINIFHFRQFILILALIFISIKCQDDDPKSIIKATKKNVTNVTKETKTKTDKNNQLVVKSMTRKKIPNPKNLIIKKGVLTFPTDYPIIPDLSYQSQNINHIVFSKNLQIIGKGAFYNNKLTQLTLPPTVADIDWYAFAVNQIQEITIPQKITIIKKGAFQKNQIQKLTLHNQITKIDSYAFDQNKITTLTLPNNLKIIGHNAFRKNQIQKLHIPNHTKTIGEHAFQENQIHNLTLSNQLKTIPTAAFYKNKIASVTLPNSVTTVQQEAFSENKISNLTLSNSLTQIGPRAFQDNQLTQVTLPEGLLTLGNGAFQNNNLKQVRIPKTVTKVGSHAFHQNAKLKRVTLTKRLFDTFKISEKLADAFVEGAQYFDYDTGIEMTFKLIEPKKKQDLQRRKASLEEEIQTAEVVTRRFGPWHPLYRRAQASLPGLKIHLGQVNKQIQDLGIDENKEQIKSLRKQQEELENNIQESEYLVKLNPNIQDNLNNQKTQLQQVNKQIQTLEASK